MQQLSSAELEDFKVVLTLDALSQLVSNEEPHVDDNPFWREKSVVEHLVTIFDARIDKIVVRRSCSYGQHINFHVDSALKTMQVSLSDDTDYEGGKLAYISKGVLKIPKRSFGTYTIHLNDIVHGVTEMISGVKYGLFFLKLRTHDSKEDESDEERLPKKTRKSSPSRLLFNFHVVYRMLKSLHKSFRIGQTTAPYLTTVMEYTVAEIIELAGLRCKDCKKKRIIPSHIRTVILQDEELNHLFGDFVVSCS